MYIKPLEARFWSKVNKTDSCWLWNAGKFASGYGQFSIKHHPFRAHRVSYELEFGRIPDHMEVCHTCDTPACVRPSHLFLGSRQENVDDAKNKERWYLPITTPKGEQSCNSKLTNEQVLEIRSLKGIISQKKLAKRFCISSGAIQHILERNTWKHI